MAVPNTYQISPESAVASYDWTDLATGLGYRNYYGNIATLSGSTVYFLEPQTTICAGARLISGANAVDSEWEKVYDKDFDLTYTNPAIIQGTMFVNMTYQLSPDTVDGYGHLRVFVYHVTAGGTETLLGSAISATMTALATAAKSRRELIPISLSRRKFRSGEKLRVTIEGWINNGDVHPTTHTISWTYYSDPLNQIDPLFTDAEGTTPDSHLLVAVPYVIDI